MSEARDNALAQLTGALTPEVMGVVHNINGTDMSVVVRSLTVKEASAYSMPDYDNNDMSVEGMRLTVSVADLGYEPTRGGRISVDGDTFTVAAVSIIGGNRRIIMTRPKH